MNVLGQKILRLLLHSILGHLHQRILLHPMFFLDLRFLQQQLKVGGELGFVYIISLFTCEKKK
jgi:hypothetical protein